MSVTKVPTRTSTSKRGAVVGQFAQQYRVDQRDTDPDDPKQGDAHRDSDPVAVLAVGAEDEEQQEGGRR